MSLRRNLAGCGVFKIGVALFESQIAFISGPHSERLHDLKVFCKALKCKIMDGKLVITDRGYQTSRADAQMFSLPSFLDDSELYNFKSQARLQHEILNGQMHHFKSMSDT